LNTELEASILEFCDSPLLSYLHSCKYIKLSSSIWHNLKLDMYVDYDIFIAITAIRWTFPELFQVSFHSQSSWTPFRRNKLMITHNYVIVADFWNNFGCWITMLFLWIFKVQNIKFVNYLLKTLNYNIMIFLRSWTSTCEVWIKIVI
jgi:hypothetical protein